MSLEKHKELVAVINLLAINLPVCGALFGVK